MNRHHNQTEGGTALLVPDSTADESPAGPRTAPALEDRRRFLSLLAHEVRAPLAAVKSYSEILLTCPPADEASRRDFLKAIGDEADRAHRLLDDITEIDKLEAGTCPFVPAPCDIHGLVERAVLAVHPLSSRKRIDLAWECLGEPGLIPGEPQLLLRCLTALAENAVKFSAPEGKVRVRLVIWEGADTVTVEVQDSGIGIPEAAAPRIWEKFFQASSPPDEVSPRGSGLGLTLAKLIADRHDGTVTYQPLAQGSLFLLKLPA